MAEAAARANPFDVFDPAPDVAPSGAVNPFDQFDAPPDVAEARHEESAHREPSRLVGIGPEGIPVFESEDDNKALRSAGNLLLRGLAAQSLGFAKGLHDVPMSINQMGSRAAEYVLPEGSKAKEFMSDQRKRVEQDIAQSEKDYQEARGEGGGPEIGRLAGNALMSAPITAVIPGANAAGLLPRVAAGGVGGAISGALQPVQEPGGDFLKQKGEQALAGGAGGAAAAPVMGAVARMIAPKVSPDVKTLMDAGVRPTPGQIMGGVSNRLEEAAQSIPFVGDAIKGARGRAVEDLNRAAINRSLEPIGEKLSPATPLGREAVGEMHDKISGNYDRLVPHLNVQADPQFINDLGQLNTLRAKLPTPRQEEVDRILQHDVFHHFDPQGRMGGSEFKQVESELGRQARSYGTSPVAAERNIGEIFGRLQQHMRDMLVRSNPGHAEELKAANEAFAHKLRIERAAASTGSDQGIFTPAQLLQAVKGLDPSMRKGAFARGDALMQELADAGKAVLGNKVPDSGTPLRSAVMAGGMLGPLYAWNPAAAAGVAGVGAAGMSAYSRPGVSALAKLLASRGPMAAPIANAVRYPGNVSLPAILAARQIEEGRR